MPNKNTTTPIEPRRFILTSPSPPLTDAEVRSFILQQTLPPAWGAQMESELVARLMACGFAKVRCLCSREVRVAQIRIRLAGDKPRSAEAITRLVCRVAIEMGCNVPPHGINCEVRRTLVRVAVVLDGL